MRHNPSMKNKLQNTRHGGFTLVEMLVATGVLVLILTMTLQITNYANNLFLSTRKRIDTFQEARAGFEVMTRKISQATLNTYWDYANGTVGTGTGAPRPSPDANYANYGTVSGTWSPTQYLRNSFLHFVAGQASVTTSGTGNTIIVTSADTTSPLVKMVGQAIFFQAPIGYSDTASNSVMPNMLNTCGYFLEYSSDNPDRPAFLTGTEAGVATGGSDALAVKFRFRLKELNISSEYMYVYSYVNNNQSKFGSPPLTRSLNWWRASSIVTAAGRPEMLALDTAIGPTSRSRSMATGWSGIRSITVPCASPRSHCSDGACRTTRLSAPGQNARMSSVAACGTVYTSPSMVCHDPTSTGTGISRPRPLAESSAVTAALSNASAPRP